MLTLDHPEAQKMRAALVRDMPAILRGEDPYLAPNAFEGWDIPEPLMIALRPKRRVIATAAARIGMTWDDVMRPSNAVEISHKRGALINWTFKKWPRARLTEVARIFGRDHSTVTYWRRSHAERLSTSPVYQEAWEAVSAV